MERYINTANRKSIVLNGQCGVCEQYIQTVKKGKCTARGHCTVNNVYKQRMETCKKFKLQRSE